jgi:hypothetical protein
VVEHVVFNVVSGNKEGLGERNDDHTEYDKELTHTPETSNQ